MFQEVVISAIDLIEDPGFTPLALVGAFKRMPHESHFWRH